MKKNRLMKASVIFAAAVMAVSATGMTALAAEENVEITETYFAAKASSESLSLTSQNAKPGETVSIPLTMKTNNKCTAFDLLIEYDSRLEFVKVEGAKASYDFEDSGKKYVSIIGYQTEPFKDGQTAAAIKLKVPKGAENDNYEVKFSQITSFSNNIENFENYTTNNAKIKVTGGVQKKTKGIELVSTVGMSGKSAVVQVVPNTNNTCSSYDVLIEYDSRLLLESKDVAGANSFCIFEENGKSYVSLVGYVTGIFSDGEAMAALNFHIPDDASANDTFEVKFAKVTSFSSAYSDLEGYQTTDGAISIVRSSRPNDKFQEYKLFQKFGPDGKIIFSGVGYRGDANNDGKADIRDAAAIAAKCLSKSGKSKIDEMGEFFGDVDENGTLNIRDAAKIARYISRGKVSWDDILK